MFTEILTIISNLTTDRLQESKHQHIVLYCGAITENAVSGALGHSPIAEGVVFRAAGSQPCKMTEHISSQMICTCSNYGS